MTTEVFTSFDEFENIWQELDQLKIDPNEVVFDPELIPLCITTDCDSRQFNFEGNECVCVKCSIIQNKVMDTNAEWRYYGSEDNKSSNPTRCGMPVNQFMPKSSIGSVIGLENTANKYFQYTRMRKYHLWNSMPYKERSLFNILNNINVQAGNNGLSQTIIDDAKVLYKKISEEKISRGENKNGLIASSIYMSCKSNDVPRSAKEIAKMFSLDITTMTKGCKKFNEIMDMNFNSSIPEDFINRFCTKLNRPDIIKTCLYVIKKADDFSVVSENAPPSIAAGIIFLVSHVCDLNINKKSISKVCEISEVTINKCFKKLTIFKQHLFPKDIIDKYNETVSSK
jgi:transcription initiation factor TFIIB